MKFFLIAILFVGHLAYSSERCMSTIALYEGQELITEVSFLFNIENQSFVNPKLYLSHSFAMVNEHGNFVINEKYVANFEREHGAIKIFDISKSKLGTLKASLTFEFSENLATIFATELDLSIRRKDLFAHLDCISY